MKKRPKPKKREWLTVQRELHRNRIKPGRVYRIKLDIDKPFIVEVRLTNSAKRMREAMWFHDGEDAFRETERWVAGLVRHWTYERLNNRIRIRPRQMVARMYLNRKELRKRGAEIMAHESTHAAMAWAKFQRANLNIMPGEEILAYAVGELVWQLNNSLTHEGIW